MKKGGDSSFFFPLRAAVNVRFVIPLSPGWGVGTERLARSFHRPAVVDLLENTLLSLDALESYIVSPILLSGASPPIGSRFVRVARRDVPVVPRSRASDLHFVPSSVLLMPLFSPFFGQSRRAVSPVGYPRGDQLVRPRLLPLFFLRHPFCRCPLSTPVFG